MNYETYGQVLCRIAQSYIGQTECGNNNGWKDQDFERKMKEVGWKNTYAWCILFSKLCVKEAYEFLYSTEVYKEEIDKVLSLITPSVMKTFSNMKEYVIHKPEVGTIVCFSRGSWKGHAGIVISIDLDAGIIWTVEGNTSLASDGNGDKVMVRKRRLNDKNFPIIGYIKLPIFKIYGEDNG